MNQDILNRWIQALEGNEYSQGFELLRFDNDYNFIGILCDLYHNDHPDTSEWVSYGHGFFAFTAYTKSFGKELVDCILPQAVALWAGLSSTNPNIGIVNQDETFAQIASRLKNLNPSLES